MILYYFFQSVAIDMPVSEEDSLETIEQLRYRYETISYFFGLSWLPACITEMVLHCCLFSNVFSFSRLQEMEELYEAKCREGEVGNAFFLSSSDNREFKHDVYGRRQTAKVDSDFLFLSCNPYINHTKIK